MLGPSCTDSSVARRHQPALKHLFALTEAGPWRSPPGKRMEGQDKLQIVKDKKRNMISYSNNPDDFL